MDPDPGSSRRGNAWDSPREGKGRPDSKKGEGFLYRRLNPFIVLGRLTTPKQNKIPDPSPLIYVTLDNGVGVTSHKLRDRV